MSITRKNNISHQPLPTTNRKSEYAESWDSPLVRGKTCTHLEIASPNAEEPDYLAIEINNIPSSPWVQTQQMRAVPHTLISH